MNMNIHNSPAQTIALNTAITAISGNQFESVN